MGDRPKHIAVVMDGNRRYADELGIPRYEGHMWGFKRLELFLKWCREYKIPEVTIYALSTKNLKRSKAEVDFLLNLLEEKLQELYDKLPKDTSIKFIGNRVLLPLKLQTTLLKLEKKTKNRKNRLNICLAYDGRDEIIRALKEAMKNVKGWELDENSVKCYFDLPSEPDLIIRTGGTRLSGFLLWQCSYSELIFLPDILWPRFQKRDFRACLEEFKNRRRTYGL